jgi:hypothetical protein
MNQQPQKLSPTKPATTVREARELTETLISAMGSLLRLVEKETDLVRAGHIHEAMALGEQKMEFSRNYLTAVTQIKNSHAYFVESSPELLTILHRHHDAFRAILKVNLTVLATVHAVSEGIIRGVNVEVQRRNIPQTYTANGRRATPGPRHMTPLTVSRSM